MSLAIYSDERPPLAMLVETRGLAAAPVKNSGGRRWRVTDDPMRHVLRMAAWNALGWPEQPAMVPRWRPALSSVTEEGARADWVTRGGLWGISRKLLDLPADAGVAIRGRFLPQLERVEEEEAHVLEAVNAPPNEICGREVVADLPDVPWTYVDAKFPASTSRRTASADPPFELQNRFGLLETEEAGDDEGAPIDSGSWHLLRSLLAPSLGPAGTPHPLCHGSASARMFMSVRRRHLSRRWRNVGPSSSQDESESESSLKLLMAWEDASCQSFCAPNVWSQNVWYECKPRCRYEISIFPFGSNGRPHATPAGARARPARPLRERGCTRKEAEAFEGGATQVLRPTPAPPIAF